MLSKKDKNSGLKQICFINDLPFCSEDNLAHLLMSEYGPTEFEYLAPNLRYSEEVLNGLRNSPGLQSLPLCSKIFDEDDECYGDFLSLPVFTNTDHLQMGVSPD